MGCGGSKVDNSPLVTLCRDRKNSIKSAYETRYALASAHVAYFVSLKEVGEALSRFVDEELLISFTSPVGSPVLTLPSQSGKKKKKPQINLHNRTTLLSSSSSGSNGHIPEDGEDDCSCSHLDFSLSSNSELGFSPDNHIHIHESPQPKKPDSPHYRYTHPMYYQDSYYPEPNLYYQNPDSYYQPHGGSYARYMKKSSTQIPSVVYEEPRQSLVQWGESSSTHSNYPQYGNAGFTSSNSNYPRYGFDRKAPVEPPAPPSPNVSAWDFFNPFNLYNNGYNSGYYPPNMYGHGSMSSSPDSKEVREREGIPELEEETEHETLRETHRHNKVSDKKGISNSKALPQHNVHKNFDRNIDRETQHNTEHASSRESHRHKKASGKEGTSNSKALRRRNVLKNDTESVDKEISSISNSSGDSIATRNPEVDNVRIKEHNMEIKETSQREIQAESSKINSLTTLSAQGTRDVQEVVKEIRDEFQMASGYGREVAVMLEVGKARYQPKGLAKVMLSRILYSIAPPSSHSSSQRPVQLTSSTMKMEKGFYADLVKNVKPFYLSSTLETLYVWEKKLYREVKAEEKLRIVYEKRCKRLKMLDLRGADSSKIDATRTSIKKLSTKINVCIKGIDAISTRIQRLRDEELQPKINELINGWTRMWKSVLKCHQKQFQAIKESKILTLRSSTGFKRDATIRATIELEMELLKWCSRFNDWVDTQRSYVKFLNIWLVRSLYQEPEETPDGPAPFSPTRAGAPPIFTICNDWSQAMERLSDATSAADAMHNFAAKLHQSWEKQDGEESQQLKSERVSGDFEKRLEMLLLEKGRNGSFVSRRDDLRVDLDLMSRKLEQERFRHKEVVRLVQNTRTGSSSIQAGLLPIFESLSSFSLEAVKAYEQVRIEKPVGES